MPVLLPDIVGRSWAFCELFAIMDLPQSREVSNYVFQIGLAFKGHRSGTVPTSEAFTASRDPAPPA